MNQYKTTYREMKPFLMLWSTQSFSALGSAMTSYALVIWSYTQERSALMTALLMVCSYAPYVIFSIFAGALSDRWNKKVTMLVCDSDERTDAKGGASLFDQHYQRANEYGTAAGI